MENIKFYFFVGKVIITSSAVLDTDLTMIIASSAEIYIGSTIFGTDRFRSIYTTLGITSKPSLLY